VSLIRSVYQAILNCKIWSDCPAASDWGSVYIPRSAYKPHSVPWEQGDGHLSWAAVARRLVQPTRSW